LLRERSWSKKAFAPKRVVVPEDFRRQIEGAQRIVVVDDALDTETTLASVIECLRVSVPKAEIRSAVLTVTFDYPSA
jgi:hypoxanthine phosphoribosyltransferase